MHQTSSPIQDQALAQQQAEEGSTIFVITSLQSFHQSVAIAMNKDIGEINPDSTQPSGYASLWQTR